MEAGVARGRGSARRTQDRLQPRRRWWWSRHVGTVLAMAATFLVALALGMGLVPGTDGTAA